MMNYSVRFRSFPHALLCTDMKGRHKEIALACCYNALFSIFGFAVCPRFRKLCSAKSSEDFHFVASQSHNSRCADKHAVATRVAKEVGRDNVKLRFEALREDRRERSGVSISEKMKQSCREVARRDRKHTQKD